MKTSLLRIALDLLPVEKGKTLNQETIPIRTDRQTTTSCSQGQGNKFSTKVKTRVRRNCQEFNVDGTHETILQNVRLRRILSAMFNFIVC